MLETLNVAVCQLTSVDDPQKNEDMIFHHIANLSDPQKIDILAFPENSLFMRTALSHREVTSFDFTEPVFNRLKKFALKNSCFIHLGSVPTMREKKLYNTSVIIDSQGELTCPFDKIHLFDIQLDGKEPTLESAVYTHGQKPAIVEQFGWKMGLSICYDLRFSELYKYYHDKEVDIIFVPSAFLVPTGRAHWEILLRARAIETQCYVLASAQGGDHGDRKSWGHSMVVSPWGEVLAEVKDDNFIIEVELKKESVDKARRQIPMKSHRRL